MQSESNQRAAMGRLLIGVSRSWRRVIDQALAEHGFSEAMALPLLVLLRSETGRRQGEIAAALHLEGPSLVRIVDLLVAEGCVTRVEDPQDRRAKILTLTREGRALALKIEKVVDQLRQRFLAQVDEADLRVTLRTLRTIEETLHSLPGGKAQHE